MLEVGKEFPGEQEINRIKLQTDWEQMLHSKYIYTKLINSKGKKVPVDPLVPIPNTISEISSDLLFGEFPGITFGDPASDEVVKEYLNNKTIDTDLLEAGVYTSAIGTILWHFFKVKDKTYYKFIQANKAIWEEDIWGLNRVIFFELVEDNKKKIYQIQEHVLESKKDQEAEDFDPETDRQYVIYEYFIKVNNSDQKINEVYDLKTIITWLNFMPIIKVLNIGQLGSKIGRSDYQGKEQMFAEIDNRIDQINFVLQENAEPWKALPSGILDQHGRFNKAQGKMFEKGAGQDNTVDIMTYDASLQAAFTQIETMVNMTFFTSRISAPIAGLEKGGNVESGRALKWRSINTMSMIERKRKYWQQAIKQAFWILSKMEDSLKNIDVSKLKIEWKDGLPLDETEVTQNVVQKVTAGLMSKIQAIKQLREINEDDAILELERIRSEQREEADIQAQSIPITLT